jgi:uncharacterized membrane protein YcaP (DUF421 family)
MNDRVRYTRVFFVLLVFGLFSLFNLVGRHGLDAMRAVDVVQLIGVGMCFGAAIFALVVSRRRSAA